MRIVKSISFDAAHFLPEAGEESPYSRMHGHSFVLEVAIEGEPDARRGWVADFSDVASALSALREKLDHHLLNSIEGLERPTLENICLWAARELKPQLKGLVQVKVSRPSIGEACAFDVQA